MGGTVSVGCKLPAGLILQVFEMREGSELVMGGGVRSVKVAQRLEKAVRLNGSATVFGTAPEHQIVGGYGITDGVDAEFFDLWQKQNADSEIVQKRLVFACSKNDAVMSEARAGRDVKSGLEPIDPNNLPKGIAKFDAKN